MIGHIVTSSDAEIKSLLISKNIASALSEMKKTYASDSEVVKKLDAIIRKL